MGIAGFKQGKVMFFALGVSSTNNLLARLVYKHLRLEGMFFLFATIKLFLFFWGRSIWLSVTSTTTTIALWSASSSFFFPGRLNTLEAIK